MAKEGCAAVGETLVPGEPTGQPEHVVRFYSVAGVSSFQNLQPTVTFPVRSTASQLCARLPLRLLSLWLPHPAILADCCISVDLMHS